MSFTPRKSGARRDMELSCSPVHVIIYHIFILTRRSQLPEFSIFCGLGYIKSISTDYVITLLFCLNRSHDLLSEQEALAPCPHKGPWWCCSSSSWENVPTRTLCSPYQLAPSTCATGRGPTTSIDAKRALQPSSTLLKLHPHMRCPGKTAIFPNPNSQVNNRRQSIPVSLVHWALGSARYHDSLPLILLDPSRLLSSIPSQIMDLAPS